MDLGYLVVPVAGLFSLDFVRHSNKAAQCQWLPGYCLGCVVTWDSVNQNETNRYNILLRLKSIVQICWNGVECVENNFLKELLLLWVRQKWITINIWHTCIGINWVKYIIRLVIINTRDSLSYIQQYGINSCTIRKIYALTIFVSMETWQYIAPWVWVYF